MRRLIIAATALATVTIAGGAVAQQRSVNDMMADMKAKHGATYDQCLAVAAARGHRLTNAEDFENRLVLMFIEGCIMGQQR